MFFQVVVFVWEFVLDLSAVMRMTGDEKDLEILLVLRATHSNKGRMITHQCD